MALYNKGQRRCPKLLMTADTLGFDVLYMRLVWFALCHTSKERKRFPQESNITSLVIRGCDGIRSARLHHPPLRWSLKRRTRQRRDQIISDRGRFPQVKSMSHRRQSFWPYLKSKESVRAASPKWEVCKVCRGRAASLQRILNYCTCYPLELQANTASLLCWMFPGAIQQHFFPLQHVNHSQLFLSVSSSHPCKEPEGVIVS